MNLARAAQARWRLVRRKWNSRQGSPGQVRRRRFGYVKWVILGIVGCLVVFPERAKKACEFTGLSIIADACAAVGIPGLPTRGERLFWETASGRSCDGLDDYLRAYPAGVFASTAREKLGAASQQRSHKWTPKTRIRAAFVGMAEHPFPTKEEATSDALARAKVDAADFACQPANEYESFVATGRIEGHPVCRQLDRGYFCTVDYKIECRMIQREIVRVCR